MRRQIAVRLCFALILAAVALWVGRIRTPMTTKIRTPARPKNELPQRPFPPALRAPPAKEFATPPTANQAGAARQSVTAPEFGAGRGFYETGFNVEVRCAMSDADIHYSTDGSEPSPTTGQVYSGPIPIDHTTVLRAVAWKPGWAPSSISTRTYIFPKDVVSSPWLRSSLTKHPAYGWQLPPALLALPSLSLVTSAPIAGDAPAFRVTHHFPNNQFPNRVVVTRVGGAAPTSRPAGVTTDKLVKASIEWLAADGGEGFQEDCGVEYYGGKVTAFEKKSFRLHFRRGFGASKLKFPLFAGHEHGLAAVQEFDQLELRSGSHDMSQRGFYVSNLFADDSLLEMGHLAPHGRYVHLYLNGAYWGIYHLRERWGANMHRRYLGGAKADYESINGNENGGGWDPGRPYDGDGRTWARVGGLRGRYEAVRPWVDIPDYIDYMILFIYGRCEDEYRCVGPTVAGSGFKFYLNDADGFFQSPGHPWYGEPSNRTARQSPGRRAGDGPASLFSTLLAEGDPDYRTLLADRIYRAYFNNGALTFTSVSNRLKSRCDELEQAFVAEAARWAYRTVEDWREVRDDVLTRWLPTRTEVALAQLRAAGLYPSLDAPVLNQQGGLVANGFQLRFQNPGRGAVHYTLDGSDPRLPGGATAPSARRPALAAKPGSATGVLPARDGPSLRIDRNTLVKSRVRDGNQWSALNEAFFQIGPDAIEAGEIRFTKLSLGSGKDGAEFIELGNVSDRALNLRGARFTAGIDYAFPDNRDIVLAPGQKLVLVKDLFRFRQRRGLEIPVEGIYTRKKNKGGDRVTLSLKSGQVVASRLIDRQRNQ